MSVPDSVMRQAKDASLPVTIRIGKSGLTEAVVVELESQLASRQLVKAKVNRVYSRETISNKHGHILQNKLRANSSSLEEMWLYFGKINAIVNPTLNKVLLVQQTWAVVYFSHDVIQRS